MDNKDVTKQRRSHLKSKRKKRALTAANDRVLKWRRSGQSELDFDSQSEDSDPARDILVQIPLVKDQKNLSNRVKSHVKPKHVEKALSAEAKRYCQNKHASCKMTRCSEELRINNRDLWNLRAHHVQRIFSIPHKENCPLYSYTRCKKLGVDFNLGSGVKQNLDPSLLTNGVMVEVYNFAIALQSAQKYFIADILEYNFHLNFKNELCRGAFAHKTVLKISDMNLCGDSTIRRLQMPFELPDSRSTKELNRAEIFCHKCYQDGNHEPHRDESDPGRLHHSHPNGMADTASGGNCSSQKPTNDPPFPTIAETIAESYLCCKEIGLSLCVNRDRPKKKLSAHVLTLGIMNEVAIFAQKLCGASTNKIINEVLEHNFNFGHQNRTINPAQQFCQAMTESNRGLAWLSEAFVIRPYSRRGPRKTSKGKEASAGQRTEAARNRKLAPQAKTKRAALQSENMRVVKTGEHVKEEMPQCLSCGEIGLDLDVSSKSGNKEKLDLKLLTRAVMYEIYTFAVKKTGKNLPRNVFDILDYNFDLSSQHYRHWEFSVAIASKVQNMIRQYRRTPHRAHEVFELPFVFDPDASRRFAERGSSQKSTNAILGELHKSPSERGRFVRQMRYHPDSNRICFLDNFKIDEFWFDEDVESLTDSEETMHMNGSTLTAGSDDRIQGNAQSEAGEYDDEDTKPAPDAGEGHPDEPAGSPGYTSTTCPNSESKSKTESDPGCVQYYILAEPQGPEGYTMLAVCPNAEGSFQAQSETQGVEYIVTVEGSQDYSVLTVDQEAESASTKAEQNSYIQMVVSDLNQVVSFT